VVRKQKTDRRDAEHVLTLLRENRFPRIWVPSLEERDVRQLLVHRHKQVQSRTRVKNQLQAMALSQGVQKKRKLCITAPLVSKFMGGFRCIAIRRKLRQRKTTGTTTYLQQQRKKAETPSQLKKVPSGLTITTKKVGAAAVPKIKQTVAGGGEKKLEKKASSTGLGGIDVNIGKAKTPVVKSKLLTQTPLSKPLLTKNKSLPKIEKKKTTSPTLEKEKEKKSGKSQRKSSGTDVLQQIFGSSSKAQEESGGRKSSIPNLQRIEDQGSR